jgi:shikimate kinase
MLILPSDPPKLRHILLIGLMGCGKTTVGREIQRSGNLAFLDTDAQIEAEQQMSIPEIFRDLGEAHFRQLETDLLRRELDKASEETVVISTGGGIVVRPENRVLLKQLGFVVWLYADLETHYQRTVRAGNRPLLQNENPRRTLAELMEQRTPWYRDSSHMSVDTTNLTAEEIACGVLTSAQVFFASK